MPLFNNQRNEAMQAPPEEAYPYDQGYGQQDIPYQDPYAPAVQPIGPSMPSQEPDTDRIEEVAEAIIDEKWNELLKDINKMIEWKEKTESRVIRLEEDVKNLQSSFESLHKGILGKISEYDKNLVDVGTEIKAMEKVFQKIIPELTDNVNRLSRITTPKK